MATSIGFDIFAIDRASKVVDRIGHAFNNLGKTAATGLGVAAVGGVLALGAAMVKGVKDAAAYQTLGFKTAAVLKSTGDVSHQSVKGIQERAHALQEMSGVDEMTIINGENVLATFTHIRDGVGKGKDIFNQATTATLNMSTALGTDLQHSTILVGKALQDPIKGLTALRRVGVSFTAQQQDQIKTMVKSGNTLGAQKMILHELGVEFGGAAKAAGSGFGGSMARAREAISDAFRAIGMQLLPVLTKLANFVATHAGPAIHTLGIGMKAMVGAFQEGDVTSSGFVGVMERIGVAAHVVWGAIVQAGAGIKAFAVDFQSGVGAAGVLRSALVLLGGAFMTVSKFVSQNLDVIGPLIGDVLAAVVAFKVVTAAVWLWAKAQAILDGTLAANPIGMVITIIALLVAAIIIAYKRSETFRNIVQGAFHGIAAAAQWMWNNVLAPVIRFILNGFASLTTGIGHFLVAAGRIPRFGWATTAGNKMLNAAAAASRLAANIRNIPNKSVTITVSVHAQTGRLNVGGQLVNIGQFATGTRSAPAGWAMVGEDGPELVKLKGNERIYNERETAAMMVGGNGRRPVAAAGGTTIVVNVNGPTIGTPQTVAQQVHQALMNLKREGGTQLGLA